MSLADLACSLEDLGGFSSPVAEKVSGREAGVSYWKVSVQSQYGRTFVEVSGSLHLACQSLWDEVSAEVW